MRRTLTFLSAAVFAMAMALPAWAQVGAGVAGNANVGATDPGHFGANADVANSDAEHTEASAPVPDAAPPTIHHGTSDRASRGNPGLGANAGVNANVGARRANVGAGAGSGNATSGH